MHLLCLKPFCIFVCELYAFSLSIFFSCSVFLTIFRRSLYSREISLYLWYKLRIFFHSLSLSFYSFPYGLCYEGILDFYVVKFIRFSYVSSEFWVIIRKLFPTLRLKKNSPIVYFSTSIVSFLKRELDLVSIWDL